MKKRKACNMCLTQLHQLYLLCAYLTRADPSVCPLSGLLDQHVVFALVLQTKLLLLIEGGVKARRKHSRYHLVWEQ